MKMLVTGAAGFIGSNYVYYALGKHRQLQLVCLDLLTYAGNLANLSDLTDEQKSRFHFVKGDINDLALLEKLFLEHDIRGVINFAAESHVDRSIHDPQVFLKTNILGTQALLDICKKYWYRDGVWQEDCRYLQVSTDEVYGSLGPVGLFTENTPLDPHSPYSASKASADLFVNAYRDTYGMPIVITRCSNNYGPYQFPEKLIPLMINNALKHEKLPVYGDGKHVRDWLYVEDHCQAIDVVYRKGSLGSVYNIGGNNECRNINIVKMIIQLLRQKTDDDQINDDLIEHVEDRLGHDRRYAIDSSKIKDELGWEPKVNFERGIRRTIEWYLDHKDWMESVISGEYLKFYEKNYTRRK
jgi:dTDP-glucose 4,6-dehydratase